MFGMFKNKYVYKALLKENEGKTVKVLADALIEDILKDEVKFNEFVEGMRKDGNETAKKYIDNYSIYTDQERNLTISATALTIRDEYGKEVFDPFYKTNGYVSSDIATEYYVYELLYFVFASKGLLHNIEKSTKDKIVEKPFKDKIMEGNWINKETGKILNDNEKELTYHTTMIMKFAQDYPKKYNLVLHTSQLFQDSPDQAIEFLMNKVKKIGRGPLKEMKVFWTDIQKHYDFVFNNTPKKGQKDELALDTIAVAFINKAIDEQLKAFEDLWKRINSKNDNEF